jgi:crooked neck
MKEKDLKEDRVAFLNAGKSFEAIHGSPTDQEKIDKQMPRKVKKRRKLDDDSFEEYVDFIFPADDESAAKLAKLMANAAKWKAAKAAKEAESGA